MINNYKLFSQWKFYKLDGVSTKYKKQNNVSIIHVTCLVMNVSKEEFLNKEILYQFFIAQFAVKSIDLEDHLRKDHLLMEVQVNLEK